MKSAEIHELGHDVFLIRSGESEFHRNIYVRRFSGADGAQSSMILDPGTRVDIPHVLQTLKALLGGVTRLEIIFLSHQDPDVSANISTLLESAPRAILVTSIDTWRLVRMYGVPDNRFFAIENMKSDPVRLQKTGHRLSFVPVPFAHFKGAMMVYDHESEILFSGDFLGGLNSRSGPGIIGTEESWKGISLFHQIYIPSNRAILAAVGRIGMLPKMPRLIAPQHGDVLPGPLANVFLERMTKLNVGLDIESERSRNDVVLLALNTFLKHLRSAHGEVAERIVQAMRRPGDFTTLFHIVDGVILELKVGDGEAVPAFWEHVRQMIPAAVYRESAAAFLDIMEEFGLSVGEKLAAEIHAAFRGAEYFS